MARLSVTTAWNETVAFVKAEARLILPLAFMLVALPASVVRALGPRTPAPELTEFTPAFMFALGVSIVLAVIGNLAMSCLAIRPGTSVREAIAQGARRAPVLVAASVLIGGAFIAIAVAIGFVVLGVVAALAGGVPDNAEATRTLGLLVLLLAPVLLYLAGRVMLMTPVAAAERGGPFTIIARSWRLTRPDHFRMMGLVGILALVALVLQRAVESLFGILLIALAGPPEPGSLSSILILLVLAVLNTVIVTYGVALVARVYAQLSSSGS